MENIDSEKPKRIVKGTSPYEDKIIAIFKRSKKSSTVRIYFGDTQKYATMSQTTFRDMRKNPRSCKYILIQKDEETFDIFQKLWKRNSEKKIRPPRWKRSITPVLALNIKARARQAFLALQMTTEEDSSPATKSLPYSWPSA